MVAHCINCEPVAPVKIIRAQGSGGCAPARFTVDQSKALLTTVNQKSFETHHHPHNQNRLSACMSAGS